LLGGKGYLALAAIVRQRPVQAVTVTLFGLFLALPFAQNHYHLVHYRRLDENRVFTPWPKMNSRELCESGGKAATKYESYFDNRYGFRDLLVQLKHQQDYWLFKRSDEVVIGRQGWMEYRNVIDREEVNQERCPDALMNQFCNDTRRFADYLQTRGIRLVVVTCPMKNTVYPEYFQTAVPSRSSTTVYDRYSDFLRTVPNLTYIDARPILTKVKGSRPVFHKTDFHWNDPAAFEVARVIVNSIGELEHLEQPVWRHPLEIEEKEMRRGGLNLSLALLVPPPEKSLFVRPNWTAQGSYSFPPGGRPFEQVYKAAPTSKQARLPSTLMIGNSFCDGFFRSGCEIYFKEIARVRTHPDMWPDVLANIPPGCRYVVLEMIEVQIPWSFTGFPARP
jgi:hypothetical protein